MTNWVLKSEINDFVGIEANYTGEDARINMINASVTLTLENLLGRKLAKQDYVEYINSQTNGRLFYDTFGASNTGYGHSYKEIRYYLKNFPVDPTGFEVHYQPNNVVDGSTKLEETDYVLDAEKGILIILKPTVSFNRAIKVVYSAGYETTTVSGETSISAAIPGDLKQAALWQAAHVYEKIKMSNINVRESRSQGSTNTSRYVNIHAIAPEAMAIIMQNKRRFFVSV